MLFTTETVPAFIADYFFRKAEMWESVAHEDIPEELVIERFFTEHFSPEVKEYFNKRPRYWDGELEWIETNSGKDLCDFCSERKKDCVSVEIDEVNCDGFEDYTETYVLCPNCNPEILN